MEKHRICKICNKRFANGKAMGGHMRSHLAKLPLPAKPQSPQQQQQQQQQQLSNSPESSPPLSSTNRAMHSSPSLDSAIHDGDSDTESHPRNPTRRRSKRRRKVIGKAAEAALEAEQVSSVSDAFSTEDVARCLIMLSMDKWGKWEKAKLKKEVDESVDEDEDEDKDEDESAFRAQTGALTQGKYKCETCNKAFRSYQALGGHRASHKKIIKTQVFDVEDDDDDDFEEEEDDDDDVIGNNGNSGNLVVDQQRTFECSFCFKQFDSGQALGGHKKVHYYNNLTHNARNVSSSSTNFVDNLVIDLNLPAPEEEDGELSQLEFSTVSD